MSDNERHRGKIKWYNAGKGMGFITPLDSSVNEGQDVFLHKTEAQHLSVTGGERVSFELGEFKSRPCAINVEFIK